MGFLNVSCINPCIIGIHPFLNVSCIDLPLKNEWYCLKVTDDNNYEKTLCIKYKGYIITSS